MFQKITKHRANDASLTVHRTPLKEGEKMMLDWLKLKKLCKKKKMQQEMSSEDKDAKAQCTAVVKIQGNETQNGSIVTFKKGALSQEKSVEIS